MTERPEQTRYGRCEATAKSTGNQCGRAAVGEHGKCDFHGGKSLSGKDSPQFKHGLFSDYLDDEDREAIDVLEEYGDAEKLDELINWRLARLRRAVKSMQDPEDQRTFWDAFEELVNSVGEPDDDQIKQLAKMLSSGNRAMQDEIDLVRKLIKDRNKIAEGEDHNVSLTDVLTE